MNHRNRTFFYALLFLALGSHFLHIGAGRAAWAVLAVQFLAYPQLAYWTARHSPHQATAELHNMLVDNVFGGLWAGLLGLPVWITFTLFIGNCINVVAFHGYPGLLRLLAAMGVGLLGGLALYGDRPLHPDIDTATSLLCILALTLFLTVFAHTSYRRAVEQQQSTPGCAPSSRKSGRCRTSCRSRPCATRSPACTTGATWTPPSRPGSRSAVPGACRCRC